MPTKAELQAQVFNAREAALQNKALCVEAQEELRKCQQDAINLQGRLAEAEQLLRELPVACACECLADVKDHVDAFLRASF